MTLVLYSTIWMALALFLAGEAGKRRRSEHLVPGWVWPMWLTGALLCTVHIVVAFASRHDWSHGAALRETARQTAAVYGVSWGGGVYVNYVFVAAWAAELWWWRAHPSHYFGRGRAITWALRLFYFVVIVNAAVVFASAPRRAAGIVLVGALLWVWGSAAAGNE